MMTLNLSFLVARDINTLAMNIPPGSIIPDPKDDNEAAAATNNHGDEVRVDDDEEGEEEDSTDEEEEEEEVEQTDPGATVADQLKEAELMETEVALKESVLKDLRNAPFTTYSVMRLGCCSHKV